MPSWNIHTAQTERLLATLGPEALGVADANAFLFGNYLPDVYVGYMVPDASMRIDYRITHFANGNLIPVPDIDRFWDDYVPDRSGRARLQGCEASLLLGSWAHLACDRCYNASFRQFYRTHEMPWGDELRRRKQADFALFGLSLTISSHVRETPELVAAAQGFGPYSVLAADVTRSIAAASAIVDRNAAGPEPGARYLLLSAAWMEEVFASCDAFVRAWLVAAAQLARAGASLRAAEVRAAAGLPAQEPDDLHWMDK